MWPSLHSLSKLAAAGVLGVLTAACGSGRGDAVPSESALTGMSGDTGSPASARSAEIELRVAGRYVPDWLLRLTRDGARLTGHAVLHMEGGGTSDAAPGAVTGSIAADGTVTLSIEPPFSPRPLPATTFVGVPRDGDLVGTIEWNGKTDDVRLASLAPGALDAHGRPLLATTRQETVAGCALDVTGAELFALENPALEQVANAQLASGVADAASHCARGVDRVEGGARVTLLRRGLLSVVVAHTLVRADAITLAADPERHSYDVASGRELALFGDVLAPGSEATLGAAIDAAIARIPDDALHDGDRAALARDLHDALASGRIAHRFGLADDGIDFDAPDFARARVTTVRSVRVPYADVDSRFLLRSSLE